MKNRWERMEEEVHCGGGEANRAVSPYVNPVAAVHIGKRSMRNVYMSRKRSRKASSTTSKEEDVEDIWVAATEADKEGTTVMAVVVPVAAAGGPNDDVGGIHGTLGHSEEGTTYENQVGDRADHSNIEQSDRCIWGRPHPSVHTTEEPITGRATDTPATVHGTGPPITQSHNMVSLFHTLQLSSTVELHVCIRTHPLVVDGGLEQMDDVVVGTDVAEETASASSIQNIIEDNRRISYSVPGHTMTDVVASTSAVYHNHDCGVPGYVVQVDAYTNRLPGSVQSLAA
ncbi:hypothetical protein Cgig2_009836 [Carnegiea gigantea]|uniref:Uncharacterized protein n=1 Tax=Carnegiea gigantea TaxID=171969 RepID=A0A9Q1KNL8_9CARY|nr:hypothetical protein Cgig2_009836 [Carnegiea gigantea]